MTRLKLCPDLLVLQREEFIFPDDDDGYPVDNKVKLIHHFIMGLIEFGRSIVKEIQIVYWFSLHCR